MAPVVMLTQSLHVVTILFGRDSGWNAQRRDDGSVPFRVTAAQYRWHTVLGLVLAGTAWAVSSSLALWMAPVVLGLALAIPLAAVTARRSAGLALRRLGLLRIPEEVQPPDVLARANRLTQEMAADQWRARHVAAAGGSGAACGASVACCRRRRRCAPKRWTLRWRWRAPGSIWHNRRPRRSRR